MNKQLVILALSVFAWFVTPAVYSEPESKNGDPLAPLRFLVGHCWQASFPDGEHRDTHCFEPFYGKAFVRDRHLVRGPRPDYYGETIYQWDSEAGEIIYRYWSSTGGVSDGKALPEADRILFPGEHHVQEDGTVLEIRSFMRRVNDSAYQMISEQRDGDGWQQLWTMEFSKVGPDNAAGPVQYEQSASD